MAAPTAISNKHDPGNASADISVHSYATRVQALIKLITDLRALGAQSEIDLPRIAVIGNQSAGKSSLVEAMTRITVPRALGTCTRCPMECRLSHSTEPFRCQIFLRIEKDKFGDPIEKVKETKFGPVLRDKGTLELMLRRAQLAILNPSVDKERFVDLDLENLQPGDPPLGSRRQLQFSANVVCIDIFSPDVTNLSFIDLPGIISNVAEGEDPENIDLIKNLVRDYISGNTLILLTITMRDDIQNQAAALLAKEADPKGTRTIGVLTKPDTLQEGEHAEWIDVLAGRKHPLTHGYYVTKQAGPAELQEKPTYEESREREKAFFANQLPWRDQDLKIRERMGVPKLTMRLSTLLSQLIEKTLPKLRKDARESLNQVLHDLQELPPPPSDNPTAELLQLIVAFQSEVRGYVRGLSGQEGLIQESRRAYEEFKKDIVTTRPNFVPFIRDEGEQGEQGPDSLLDGSSSVKSNDIIEEEFETETVSMQEPLFVDEVRDRILSSTTRELPFNVPYQAKVYCIDQCFKMWSFHSRACFDKVWAVYQSCLNDLVLHHFEEYSNGGLFDQVRSIIDSELDRVKRTTLHRIEWLLQLEKDPFTLNDHYLSYRHTYLTSFKEQRQKTQDEFTPDPNAVNQVLAGLTMMGINCVEEDLTRLHGPDPYESELTMMAEVAAYFRVAYTRFIDNLPRVIDVDFLKELERGVYSALISGLGMDGSDSKETASHLLSEDHNITSRRQSLQQVQERLEAITAKLNNFAALRV